MARQAALDLASHADGRADLAGRAVAALETVMVDERLLQWMQVAVLGQALDGGDRSALILHGEGEAGEDRSPSTNTVQAPHAP